MAKPSSKANIIISFYESPDDGKDFAGRSLSSILSWSDAVLESKHDYIQVLFPLPETTPNNSQAPILDRVAFNAFRGRPDLRQNMRKAFDRMMKFYSFDVTQEAPQEEPTIVPMTNFDQVKGPWFRSTDHNHRRISRMIRSLRILGLVPEAEAFYCALRNLDAAKPGKLSKHSVNFWRQAARRLLNVKADEKVADHEKGTDFLVEYERGGEKPW